MDRLGRPGAIEPPHLGHGDLQWSPRRSHAEFRQRLGRYGQPLALAGLQQHGRLGRWFAVAGRGRREQDIELRGRDLDFQPGVDGQGDRFRLGRSDEDLAVAEIDLHGPLDTGPANQHRDFRQRHGSLSEAGLDGQFAAGKLTGQLRVFILNQHGLAAALDVPVLGQPHGALQQRSGRDIFAVHGPAAVEDRPSHFQR